MTAAPERIWAMPDFTDHDDGTWSFGEWLGHKPDFTNGCIEYIAVTALSRAPEVLELIRQAVEADRERLAQIGYRVCAETRHVTLGNSVAAAIRAGE